MRAAPRTTGEYTSGCADDAEPRGMKNCSIPGGNTGNLIRGRTRCPIFPGRWGLRSDRGGPRVTGFARPAIKVRICSRDNGPRRYDSVQRVWK